MSLDVDSSKYFLIHHTPADTIDKINPVEMAKCAAAVAVMAYVIADLPNDWGLGARDWGLGTRSVGPSLLGPTSGGALRLR